MAETYDLILKGGTVVNQDGEGLRDIGIRDGRFAAIGDLSQASAGETSIARACICCPA
jgi:dihydroorotase